MANQNLHIDELFLRGLGGYTEVPPSAVWNTLNKRLDGDKSRPFGWWWIALVLLTGTIGAYFAKDMLGLPRHTAATAATAPATIVNEPVANNTSTQTTTTQKINTEETITATANNNKQTITTNNTDNTNDNSINSIAAKKKHTNTINDPNTTTTSLQPGANISTPIVVANNTSPEKKKKKKKQFVDNATITTTTQKLTDDNTTTSKKQTPVINSDNKQKTNFATATTTSDKKDAKSGPDTAYNKRMNPLAKTTAVKDKSKPKLVDSTPKKNGKIAAATSQKKDHVIKVEDEDTKKKRATDSLIAKNKETKKQDIPVKDNQANNTTTQKTEPTFEKTTAKKQVNTGTDTTANNTTSSKKLSNKKIDNNTYAATHQIDPSKVIEKPITDNKTNPPLNAQLGKLQNKPADKWKVAKDSTALLANKSHVRLDVGVKASYSFGTHAFSINSLVLSPYFELKLSDKFSIQFEPGIKINGTGGGAFKQPERFISPNTVDSFIGTNGTWNISSYKHTFDSVTKYHSIDATRTTEIELPLIFKFKTGNGFYIFAGPVFTIGDILAITTTTTSVHGSISGIDSVQAPGYLSAANVYIKYHTSPLYSTYDSSQYQNPTTTNIRTSIVLGINYNPDDRLGLYFSIQPNISNLNNIPNNTIGSLYSQTYIRVGVSYKLFGKK